LIAERSACKSGWRAGKPLQWGRDRLIAERRGDQGHVHAADLASMGPRSFDRGKLPEPIVCSSEKRGFNGAAIV